MKIFDGQIKKVRSEFDEKSFFDFEFWGESDVSTYGLLSFTQVSDPKKIFIMEMNSDELAMLDTQDGVESARKRASIETGIKDLVSPKIVKFREKKDMDMSDFQSFLKSYKPAIAVYESIFDNTQEAVEVEQMSIEKFEEGGGSLKLLGELKPIQEL